MYILLSKIMKPLVSVLMPTYNRGKKIIPSIKSILNQTYDNLELIIVEDGSKKNIAESFIKSVKDNRLRYIRTDINKGPAAARNIALKVAHGDYITFCDHDDEWLPEKLEIQVNLIKKLPLNYVLIHSRVLVFSIINKRFYFNKKIREMNKNQYESILKNNNIRILTCMIKKNVFDNIGFFDENLFAFNDWDMWIRILKKYDSYFIQRPLAIKNDHYSNQEKTMGYKANLKDFIYLIKKHRKELKKKKLWQYKRVQLAHQLFNLYRIEGNKYFFRVGISLILEIFKNNKISIYKYLLDILKIKLYVIKRRFVNSN